MIAEPSGKRTFPGEAIAMLSPERLDLMQQQWVRLLTPDGVSPADAYPVFDRLVAAYQEPQRHYHTLEHLAEMFRVVGRLGSYCQNLRAVQLAVWFHDAVYDPRAKDNETRSALLAAECLDSLAVLPDLTAKVAELVQVTAHLSDDRAPADADTAVLLDADLAILGASEVRYQRYAADIRREYAFVPDDAYRKGRAEVLNRFLARERIYHTAPLQAEGEEAARRNIRAELERLHGERPT